VGCPATGPDIAAFGFAGTGGDDPDKAAFPKARVVTISECASHAMVDARIGGVAGKGAGEQSMARPMLARLEQDWLLIADRNFDNWDDWRTAADTGAALLWRAKADLRLPVLELLPAGSYRSVLVSPKIKGNGREQLIEAARRGEAATEADIDPDRVKFKRTVRLVRRRVAHPAFPPERRPRATAGVMTDITRAKNLNPPRRDRTCPRVIKRARHNSYRVKKPGDHGTRHEGPATIKLVNLSSLSLASSSTFAKWHWLFSRLRAVPISLNAGPDQGHNSG
jgi:hypothetical protein